MIVSLSRLRKKFFNQWQKKQQLNKLKRRKKLPIRVNYLKFNQNYRRKENQSKERQECTKESHLCLLLLSKGKKRNIKERTTIIG
jgi:hypothetical protein